MTRQDLRNRRPHFTCAPGGPFVAAAKPITIWAILLFPGYLFIRLFLRLI